MKPKSPSVEQLECAAEWLDVNEGDGGEREFCAIVAKWLRRQATLKMLRDTARDAGVPVAEVRKRLLGHVPLDDEEEN